MLIVCPSCASTYTLSPERLGAAGRRLRCAACRAEWFASAAAHSVGADGEPIDVAWEDAPPAAAPLGLEGPLAAAARRGDAPEGQSLPPPQARMASTPRRMARLLGLLARILWFPVRVLGRAARMLAGRLARLLPMRAVRGCLRQMRAVPIPALAAGLVGTLAIGMVVARETIVRHVPPAARLYVAAGLPVNLRGLQFRAVKSEVASEAGAPLLVVEGEVANITAGTRAVPPILIAVRSAAGQPLYSWTAEPLRPMLAAGETLTFRARLAAPPPDGNEVMVRFAAANAATAR